MIIEEVVLDTETTGLSLPNDRIIEICGIKLHNRTIVDRFHVYLNPGRDVSEDAYKIHGISTEFLKDKPKFADIANSFLSFIKGTTLVIHNARFDINFLNYEFSLINMPTLAAYSVVDTLALAREKLPGKRVNLNALCREFKIDLSKRKFHGAVIDTELLVLVYRKLIGYEEQIGLVLDTYNTVIEQRNYHEIPKFKVVSPTSEEISNHIAFMKKITNNLWYKDII